MKKLIIATLLVLSLVLSGCCEENIKGNLGRPGCWEDKGREVCKEYGETFHFLSKGLFDMNPTNVVCLDEEREYDRHYFNEEDLDSIEECATKSKVRQ